MRDAIKTAIVYALLALCALLGAAAWLGHARLGIATDQRNTARAERDRLTRDINAQKKEAREKFDALNASVLAQQKRLDADHLLREKTDVASTKTIDGLHTDLRRMRAAARGVLDVVDGGRGGGSGSAASEAAFRAFAGAGDRAEADRLVPATPDEEADGDAYDADRVNAAYASCRADAFSVRQPAAPP